MRLDIPRAVQSESPTFVEPLEDRLCLSATHHHFYTGVRPHVTTTVTAAVGHSRHHFHTGVRARATDGGTTNQASIPPTNLGVSPTGTTGTTGAGTGSGGLFGGGGGLFGGGGGLFG